MKKNKTVCMISCRHNLLDDRIYKKQALTLARNGYELIHIGYGDTNKDYYTEDIIRLIQIEKKTKGKTLKTAYQALKQSFQTDLFQTAKSVKADIYHLHDVELCRIALKLKKLPWMPKVIYDAHEPYYERLLDYWRERSFAQIFLMDIPALIAEKNILKKVDYLIATEENIAARFKKKNPNSSVVYNYSYFYPDNYVNESQEKEYDAVYCGGIFESKGIFEIFAALVETKKRGLEYKVVFVGDTNINSISKNKIERIIRENNLDENVNFTGNLPFEDVAEYYKKSKVGFCIFPSSRVNKLILPIKVFEYPAFGLPVIGSNFGHIKNIVEENNIGITVNPANAKEVADALIHLVEDDNYRKYYQSCVSCVKNKYMWNNQEENLLSIYRNLKL